MGYAILRRRYLIIALFMLSIVSLLTGVSKLSLADLLTARLTPEQLQVLWVSRVPRLLALILAGSGLAVCGRVMQQLTQNRFVSPTTAGTMDSARLGILVALLLFPAAGSLHKMTIAFIFALLGTYVFLGIVRRLRFRDPVMVPLAGLMFGNIVSAITTFFAYKHNLIQAVSAWLLGNFALVLKGRYELLYFSVPAVILVYLLAGKFTAAGLGEDVAASLGLSYRQVLNIGLTIVAFTTSAIVLTVGMIPFLGLIVPNIVSIYHGDHIQRTHFHTALLGAVLVLACDIVSRLIIFPYEIPISLTLGVIGSAIFAYLLMKRPTHA